MPGKKYLKKIVRNKSLGALPGWMINTEIVIDATVTISDTKLEMDIACL